MTLGRDRQAFDQARRDRDIEVDGVGGDPIDGPGPPPERTADDAHLNEPQLVEERIGSVDYDVWKCPSCSHHFTLRYAKWLTGFGKCPQCHNHTKSSEQTTIVAATTSSSGSAKVYEKCEFCSYRNEYTKTLPRIQQTSSSSGGSGGSSFGGGRSGGGGASRGY